MAADLTSRMIHLLGELRREMNGAVADAMRYYGSRYGLNYGVSLPTIRSIAATEPQNNDLALYLYKQDVRELRLTALHIAEPSKFYDSQEAWRDGITTSEIAEEMAFALLSKAEPFVQIYDSWRGSEQEFVVYAALMAAARKGGDACTHALASLADVVQHYPSSRLVGQGVVAVMSAALAQNLAQEVRNTLQSLPDSPAQEYILDEMSWRME